ncbi:MAG: histidine phosphatase family protein [Pseudomonadota bacterium]
MVDALTADNTFATTVAARPGAVILARHGEPDLSRKVRLSADEYRLWWGDYETRGLRQGQRAPDGLKDVAQRAGFVIASTRPRSLETARAVCAGRSYAEDPLFIEAPLPPPRWPRWVRLSPRLWGFIARFWWWFFDHNEGEESRAQAQQRADQAARMLADMAQDGQDVLVVAHGFFNGMVGESLKRLGWRCTEDQGFRYWRARRFERP